MQDRFDATLLTIAAIALIVAGVLGTFDLVRGSREQREYDEHQRNCQAYAKTLFPHGEVDPRAWCEP
jgi:hypothetical protein